MSDDVLDRIENRGIQKGREEGREIGKREGEDNMLHLSQKLFAKGRIDDWKRAMDDKEYREQLKKEFGIR